jgi:hypothetical protein
MNNNQKKKRKKRKEVYNIILICNIYKDAKTKHR